jgi:hypothetical protein
MTPKPIDKIVVIGSVKYRYYRPPWIKGYRPVGTYTHC